MATCLVTLFCDSYFTVRWLPEKKRVFKQLFSGKNAKCQAARKKWHKQFQKKDKDRCNNIIIKGKQKYYL